MHIKKKFRGKIMRKKVKLTLIIFILAAIGTAAYFYIQNLTKSASAAKTSLEPVIKNVNGINIIIDPRMELLSAVQALSSYDKIHEWLASGEFTYKSEMNKYFSKFSGHKAVKEFDSLMGNGILYNSREMMLYLSNPPSLSLKQYFSDNLKSQVGPVKLEEFPALLKEFAADTKFYQFYNSRKEFYNSIIEKNAEVLNSKDYISSLEQYYGTKQNSYNIILTPMLSGAMGPSVKNSDGKLDLYCILGEGSLKGNELVYLNEDSYKKVIYGIFSYPFVVPLVQEKREEIFNYSELFIPISEKMEEMYYPNWDICVWQHIVRAVQVRETYRTSGKEKYESEIRSYKQEGFAYIEELAKRLEVYENNRDKYKTFESFFPQLIKVFEELNSKDLGEDFYKS
jgi:hypothetical protein